MANRTGSGPEPVYLALIGDVRGSRTAEDRADLQRRLTEAVAAANDAVPAGFAAPLRITAGDEVQGLLAAPGAAVGVLAGVEDRVRPATLDWGLGFGPLTTDPGADPAALDGPCFHAARAALESARAEDAWGAVRGLVPPLGAVASSLLRLMGTIRREWTDKQAGYVRDARHQLQKDVAAAHDVSPSVVSESLKAAHFRVILDAEESLAALLEAAGADPGRHVDSVAGPNSSEVRS